MSTVDLINTSISNKSKIYLGSVFAANDLNWLRTNNVTNILGLINYQNKYVDINYLTFPDIYDSPDQNIIQYLNVCFQFITKALNNDENILIHCHAGPTR